ncbi:phage distal tail protein [Streptomyces sp. NPDC018045]|uniref:phage distal tail protein n=1 Tax=Streptomyces sp. NPDC018045 TaxID=3365037 RepID=UPI00379E3181
MAAGDLVTLPGHIQYGDLLIGPGTAVRWKSVTGWLDTPSLDSGTVVRSDGHGAYPGPLYAQPRTITVDGLVIRTAPGAMSAAVRTLSAHLALRDDELPLVIRLDDAPPLMCWARCLRRSIPVDTGYRIGTSIGGAIQFEATDPRRYSLTEQRIETRLPSPEPGLDWHHDPGPEHLDWQTDPGPEQLDFGAPGSTGALIAVNEGDADAHPVIVFRGPVARPSLTNLRTGEAVEYDIDLAADDVLHVDTNAGTVTLNGNGGASRLHTATARSIPEQAFTLAPGVTQLAFRAAPGSSDPRASVTVRYRSAYW